MKEQSSRPPSLLSSDSRGECYVREGVNSTSDDGLCPLTSPSSRSRLRMSGCSRHYCATWAAFWRLMLGLMILAAATNAQATGTPDEAAEEFFYAVESEHQTYMDALHPKKRRSLQDFVQPPVIPTLPPFSFPPIPPIVIPNIGRPSASPTRRPTPQPTFKSTPQPSPRPSDAPIAASTQSPSKAPVQTTAPITRPTARPSPRPTPRPSPSPTPAPFRFPGFPFPTATPTRQPVIAPTPRPTRRPTRQPTPGPTPRPSPRPSPQPTRRPTQRPTRAPTPQPTRRPTRRPTRAPTPRPSPRPTFRPTRMPNDEPTVSPTLRPTRRPTQAPTPVPTNRPTRIPTMRPTLAPNPGPTNRPTFRPTTRPTDRPTLPPTTGPTGTPSFRPTATPTRAPTDGPTTPPTRAPSPRPTRQPSLAPTPLASDSPSQRPSNAPSLRPSNVPSVSPSSLPSVTPTESPSMTPSVSAMPSVSSQPSLAPTPDFEFPLTTLEAFRVIMEFTVSDDGRRLQENGDINVVGDSETVAGTDAEAVENANTTQECVDFWMDFVTQRMENEVAQVIPLFETLRVNALNVSRDSFEDLSALVFFYDVKIEIRSAITVHNLRRYIGGPFDSRDEKAEIVEAMQRSGCQEYETITAVTLTLPDDSNISGVQGNSNSSSAGVGVIAGSIAAIAATALLIGVFIFVRVKRRGNSVNEVNIVTPQQQQQMQGFPGPSDNDIASEIGLNTDLEVSTLGDPILPSTFPNQVGDVSTAGSFTLDYDYKTYYQEGPSILEGDEGSAVSNIIVPADDDTFEAQYGAEEQFEVLAPAGVLGLILETNKDGVPTINNIKPASVLIDQVQIGDRLLSVDGIDVSVMLASEVSRLIASKKDEPTRKFTFTRPVTRRDSYGEDVLE